MDVNDSNEQKDLAFEQKKAEEISEKISVAMLNGQDEVILEDGSSYVKISILESIEKKGEYDIEFGGRKIATVKKGQKIVPNKIRLELERYRARFNIREMETQLGRIPEADEIADPESLKIEKELKDALKDGRAEKLRTGREITAAGEDMSLMMRRMFGQRAHEIYRVRDKNDPHKFTYIGKGNDGKYFEPKGSRANEGTNARQMCWIQNKDGSFEKKTVDDMKVFGKYVIATDINTTTDSTRTLVGQRTPRGEYILMPALDYRVADTVSNGNMKDNLARGNSIWEIQDVVLAAELGETIRGTKKDGKLSADEVEFIKKLKKEGLEDDKIKRIMNAILIIGELKDIGLNDTSIKALLDTVESTAEQLEELKKENFGDEEIKTVMEAVHKDGERFKEAKKEVKEDREQGDEDDGEKIRGQRAEGPWASNKH